MGNVDEGAGMSRRGLLATGAAAVAAPAGATVRRTRTRPVIVNALGGLENPNLDLTRPPGAAADTSRPDERPDRCRVWMLALITRDACSRWSAAFAALTSPT